MDQDNLNKQQQYLSAIQDPTQFHQGKSEGIFNSMYNWYNGQSSNKQITKKVEVTGGGFFSKKVFTNNMWQQNQQNQGQSPAPRMMQDKINNPQKQGRVTSPRKQNTQVNTYEYSNNTAKKLGTNQEPKSSLSTDNDFKKKFDIKNKTFQSSAQPNESASKNDQGDKVVNRDSQGSNSSNKM